MARTFRNNKTRFDDEQDVRGTGHKKRHANNHITGGIRPTRTFDEDELDQKKIFDRFGVRVRISD